ncbi:MAG: hypothetical protein V4673_04840 [Pseudomonadota bacterium]
MTLSLFRIERRSATAIALLLSIVVFFSSCLGDSTDREVAGPESAVRPKDAVAIASPSSHKSDARQKSRRGNDAVNAVYDANATLASQLSGLRALSDNRDPYATCVLAWALDLCSRDPDRVSVSEYFNADIKHLDEKNISDIAGYFEYHERYGKLCAGLVETDFWDSDHRLLQSARMGHARSMTMFAQFSAREGSGLGISTPDFLRTHRENAEKMLNMAAAAGDPAAIREIYNAYSSGYITSGLGDVEVEIDLAKSMAALHAIALHANKEDKQELDQGITAALSQMDHGQRLRFDHFTSSYSPAYRSEQRPVDQFQLALDDFPERVCAETRSWSAGRLGHRPSDLKLLGR